VVGKLVTLSASPEKTVNLFMISEKRSKPLWCLVGFALIPGVGILDYLTGYEIAFSLFYLIPISLLTWIIDRRLGIVACLAGAVVWLLADIAAGSSYSHPVVYAWNTLIRLSFFLIVTFLLSALKKSLERERELAHTDYLTGAMNSRFFFEFLQMEIDRFRRYQHPFSLAYIDLDNFKALNDRFGHMAGDQVLRTVVSHTKSRLRKTDVVARLGGDEFALLLPETDQESAKVAISKIQSSLLQEMQKNRWPITLSMGVLTCTVAPPTRDELVRMADDLMYIAKREGKNAIRFSTYSG
jgi:diguanylate cyclase (GGDEF)-like protein